MSFEIDGLKLVRIPSTFLCHLTIEVKMFLKNDIKQWQGLTLVWPFTNKVLYAWLANAINNEPYYLLQSQ